MKKYFYTKTFLILLIILWVPFIIKIKSRLLEIYPSVVMPVGSGVHHLGNNFIEQTKIEIWASNDGELVQLNFVELFPEVPPHYLLNFHSSSFGTEATSYKPVIFNGIFNINRFNRINAKEISESQTLLKKKLLNLGYSDKKIILRKYIITFDILRKVKINKEIIDEKTIDLN